MIQIHARLLINSSAQKQKLQGASQKILALVYHIIGIDMMFMFTGRP